MAQTFADEKRANQLRNARNASRLGAVGAAATDAAVRARAEIDDERELQAKLYEIRQEEQQKKLDLLKQFAVQAREAGDLTAMLDYEKQAADLSVKIEQDAITEKARLRRMDADDAKRNQAEVYRAVTSVLSSTASAYESLINARLDAGQISQKEAENEFKLVKAFQVSQTWINTLAGMMGIWGNGEPSPWYVKAAQSAAVLAQGVAATAQISATQVGQGGGSSAGAVTSATQAVQAAPVVINTPSQVRTLTSASDEVALNQRTQAQRVVLVYSDLQAFGKKVQVTHAESQF